MALETQCPLLSLHPAGVLGLVSLLALLAHASSGSWRLWASVLLSHPTDHEPFRGALVAEVAGAVGGRRAGVLEGSPPQLGWAPVCVSSQSVVRICCIRSFGHFVARLQGSILQFSSEVGIFVSTAQSEQESLLQQAQAQFRMVSQPRPRSPLLPVGSRRNQRRASNCWWPLTEEGGAWGWGN